MKKIRFFSLFILICVLLTGCSSTADVGTDTDSVETSASEPIYYSVLTYFHNSAFATVEYEFSDTESFSSEPAETKEFTLLGKTYEVIYDQTIYTFQLYYPNHVYSSNDIPSVAFDHRGYISQIKFSPSNESNEAKKISRDEAIEKAVDFIKEIMIKEEKFSIDDYEISTVFNAADGNESFEYYQITFQKQVGDYYTQDSASIQVRTNGDITSFSSSCLGMINKDADISFDLSQVKRCVDEKLDSIYKNQENELGICNLEYEHPQTPNTLIRLKNGTLALKYDVRVKYKNETSPFNVIVCEQINFIIQ